MDKKYYSMPFITEQLGKKEGFEKCDLDRSIRQNLRLLLVTPPGRIRFDPHYGCRIHLSQFLVDNWFMEGKKIEDKFKQKIEDNIVELINRFEPRLLLKEVSVQIQHKPIEQIQWKLQSAKNQRISALQVTVLVRGEVKPEYAFDQNIEMEDTIHLM